MMTEATHTVLVIDPYGRSRIAWRGGGELWFGTEQEAHVFAAKLCRLRAHERGTAFQVVTLPESKPAKRKRR